MPHTFLYYAPVMLISSFQYCVVPTRLSSVLLFCQSSSEWDGMVVSLVSVLVGISSSMLLLAPYSSLPPLTHCPSPSCDSCPSREWIVKLLHVLFCGPNLRTPPISSQLSSYYAGIICSVLPAANYYASIIYAGLYLEQLAKLEPCELAVLEATSDCIHVCYWWNSTSVRWHSLHH